jgi:hypothetical protein
MAVDPVRGFVPAMKLRMVAAQILQQGGDGA